MGAARMNLLFLCVTCLHAISSASPAINEKPGGKEVVGESGSSPTGNEASFTTTNSFAESSVVPSSSSSSSSDSYKVNGIIKGPKRKRDKEEEADSANGKSPIPFLFKKSQVSGTGEESRVFGNEYDFSEFPPLVGNVEDPVGSSGHYQRQRRSSFMPDGGIDRKVSATEELDNREEFLRLLSYLAASGDEKNGLLMGDGEPLTLRDGEREFLVGDSGVSDEDDSFFMNKPISLMSSGGDVHLSEVPGSHGLYVSPHKETHHRQSAGGLQLSKLGPTYPLNMMRRGGLNRESVRDYLPVDNGNEWMEDAIPLLSYQESEDPMEMMSYPKVRRSDGGNSVFTFNPVKSHFRRINRTPAQMLGKFGNYYNNGLRDDGGRYGSAGVRKRRSSASNLRYM